MVVVVARPAKTQTRLFPIERVLSEAWLDCVDAQANLSIRLAYMSEGR